MVERRDDFELSIVESLESNPAPEEREGITAVDLITTPEESLEAFKATKGGFAILEHLPRGAVTRPPRERR